MTSINPYPDRYLIEVVSMFENGTCTDLEALKRRHGDPIAGVVVPNVIEKCLTGKYGTVADCIKDIAPL
ncbi:MAG: hypothetical protein MMC23_004282, partial [Stictis urceolatum]|nr:hypothetical protein [Stictis urceolata]